MSVNDKIRFRQGSRADVQDEPIKSGQLLFATYEDEHIDSSGALHSIRQGDIYFDVDNQHRVNLANDVDKARTIYSGTTNTNDVAGAWTITLDGINELYDGLTIAIRLSTTYNSTYNTLNVNNLGPKLVWYRDGGRATSHLQKGAEVILTYRQKILGSLYKTPASGGPGTLSPETEYSDGWIANYSYDSGNSYERYLATYVRKYVGTTAVLPYHFVVVGADDRWYPINTTNTTNQNATHTALTVPFNPNHIYWNPNNTTYNANTACSAAFYYSVPIGNAAQLRQNFSRDVPAYHSIYLQGEYNVNTGLFTLDSNYYVYISNNPSVTTDSFTTGKYYIYLGDSYSSANYMQLAMVNSLYKYNGQGLVSVGGDGANHLNNSGTAIVDLTSTNAVTYTDGGNIQIGVSGTLPVTRGGTGTASLPTAILQGNGANAVTKATATGNTSTPIFINSDGLAQVITSYPTQKLSRPDKLNGLNDVTLQSLVSTTRANRLAFLPADQIIIEKTTNGGSTWVDAGFTDAQKTALFSETRPSITLPLLNSKKDTKCGLRITITAMKYNVPSGTAETNKYNYWNSSYVASAERYCQLKEFYFWVNSNNDGISVKVERATGANSTSWSTVFDSGNDWAITGWSGCDYIKFAQNTFGGSTSQTTNYWNYRLTFFTRNSTGGTTLNTNTTYQGSAQSLAEIRGYGDTVWTVANNYMANDHLYSFDANKNATFPAKVTATEFIGDLAASHVTGILGVPHGGTGANAFIANGLLQGNGSNAISSAAAIGSASQPIYIGANGVPALVTSFSGNATSASKLDPGKTIAISGAVTGTATLFDGTENITIPATAIDLTKGTGILPVTHGGTGVNTIASGELVVGAGQNQVTTIKKDSANTASAVVQRDASGNFSAGTITANLTGKATTAGTADEAIKLKTGRTLKVNLASSNASTAFDGTANITDIGVSGILPVTYGGTGNNTFTSGKILIGNGSNSIKTDLPSVDANGNINITTTSTQDVKYIAANANGSVSLFASTNRGLYDVTNSKWIIQQTKAGDHTYITLWSSKGSATKPVYFTSNGEPAEVTMKTLSINSKSIPIINSDNIDVGIIGVPYGGTGRNTLTANNVLIGAGSSQVGLVAPASGAFYATDSNSAPKFGTLPVAQGGTGNTTFAANSVLVGDGTNKIAVRAIVNNSAVGALGWNTAGNTNVDNLRIPDINTIAYWNGAYSGTSSNLSILGTITTGTWNAGIIGVPYGGTGRNSLGTNSILAGNGANQVNLISTKSGAFYATAENGAAQFGTLPVAQGGTGNTTFTAGEALIGNGTSGIVTRAITNVTTASSAVTANTNLITANTLNNFKGTASTNTVGTISTGTWQGSIIQVPYGGTGRNSLTANAVIVGNGSNQVNLINSASGALYATTANGAPQFGTLPVAQGGTGLTTSTYKNAIITGNTSTATSAFSTVRTNNGAFYATAQDGTALFGTLPIAQGGTGLTASPSLLVDLSSNTAANVFQASPRPGVTGALKVANGGTGSATSLTADRLIYSASTTSMTSSTNMAINNTNNNLYPAVDTTENQLGLLNNPWKEFYSRHITIPSIKNNSALNITVTNNNTQQTVTEGTNPRISLYRVNNSNQITNPLNMIYSDAYHGTNAPGILLANTTANVTNATRAWLDIQGKLFVGDSDATTNNDTTASGSIQTQGGAYIKKQLYVGSDFWAKSNAQIGSGVDQYTRTGTAYNLTASNITSYFDDVTNGTYAWTISNDQWSSSNASNTNTDCTKSFKAKYNCLLTVSGTRSLANYDSFSIKINGTEKFSMTGAVTGTFTQTDIQVPKDAIVQVVMHRGTNTSTSYTHDITAMTINYQQATVTNTQTTMKDVTSFTNTTDSTSATSGAVKISGGAGIAKNLYVGGNENITGTLTNTGDASFTNGTFKTQNYVYGSGSAIPLNSSNIETYFTITNNSTYPWIAPGEEYQKETFTASGSTVNVTSSNLATYFTVTAGTNDWSYDSSEGAFYAGDASVTSKTYERTLVAKQNCQINVQYKKHAYSNEYFYLYWTPSGQTQQALISATSSSTATTYTSKTIRLKTGDTLKLYFNRSTNTSTSYNHNVFVKLQYQAATIATETVINGDEWLNGNFKEEAVGQTTSMTLVAKNNFITRFTQTGNTNGLSFTLTKNGTAIASNADIQVFNGDTIVMSVVRSTGQNAYYNFQPTWTYQIFESISNSAGSTGKEVVSIARQNRFIGNIPATSTTTGTVQVTGGVGVSGDVYANSFVSDWVKGKYLRINSNNTDSAIQALIYGTTQIGSGDPQYTPGASATTLTGSNIETYFTVEQGPLPWRAPNTTYYTERITGTGTVSEVTSSNASSYFTVGTSSNTSYPWQYDATNHYWYCANTQDHHSITSTIELTATTNSYLELDWSVLSESVGCDWLQIYVDGASKLKEGGNPAKSGTLSIGISTGQKLKFEMRKDGSVNPTGEYYRVKINRYASSSVQQIPHNIGDYWQNGNVETPSSTAQMTLTAKQNCVLKITSTVSKDSNSYFYVKQNGTNVISNNSTSGSQNYTLNIPQGAVLIFQNTRSGTNSGYSFQTNIVLNYYSATVTNTLTTMKDVTTFTRTDEATSTTSGAVKVQGGMGVAKNLYIGGNEVVTGMISNTGDTSFTSGVLKTQNYVYTTATNSTVLTPDNIGTYFTVVNNSTYPWVAPGETYSNDTFTTSGSSVALTSSNLATYFTVVDGTNPWSYDSTEGVFYAGRTAVTANTTYEKTLTAKRDCQITFQYRKKAYSQSFYVYWTPVGKTQQTLFYNTGSSTQASGTYSTKTARIKTGDVLKFYFQRQYSTNTNYTIDNATYGPQEVCIKMTELNATFGTETLTNNTNYWINSGYNESAMDQRSIMTLVAKQNLITKFLMTNNGATTSITKNGAAISFNTDIQVFNGDTIVITGYRQANTYYNLGNTSSSYKAELGFNISSGSTGKEVVITGRQTRLTGGIAATSKTTGTLQVDGGVGVTGNIYATQFISDWLKGTYLRVNSNDTQTTKQAIITGNIDLGTGDTVFTGTGSETNLTSSNETTPFTVTNDAYTFTNTSGNTWINNNSSVTGSTAKKTWVAKSNYILKINYTYSSYYGSFYIYQNGTTKASYTSSTTNYPGSITLNVKTGDTIVIQYSRGTNTSTNTSYTFTLSLNITYQAANTADTFTILKDDVSITKGTESTSTTTGVLKVTGGVGITKNTYIGGSLNVAKSGTITGNVSLTGELKTQDYITAGTGSAIAITSSNYSSYFNNWTNNSTYPWIAPSASYTDETFAASGSEVVINGTNIATYFTVTNGTAYPEWNSTNSYWYAGGASVTTSTTYEKTLIATSDMQFKISYKFSGYSGDYFYVYYTPTGTTQEVQLVSVSNTNQTTYTTKTYRVKTGDKFRIRFQRGTNTNTSYTHDVSFTMTRQAATFGTTTATNGAYWLNGNFGDTKLNTTSSLKMTAKNNCMLTFTCTNALKSGDSFTIFVNNTSRASSTTTLQIFANDVIELRYVRGNYNYNYSTPDSTAQVAISYVSGTVVKEAIIESGRLRPGGNNTVTLGDPSYRWKSLFIGTADSYGTAADKPIYWNNGIPAPMTGTKGSGTKLWYMNGGVFTDSTSTVGATDKPVYLNAGVITVSSSNIGSDAANAVKPIYMASGQLKAVASTVGSTTKPIWMDAGTLKASTATVGTATQLMYLSSGTLTASTTTVGANNSNDVKPVFLSSGTITVVSQTLGADTANSVKPIWMTGGSLKAVSQTVGATNKPVYMNAGAIVPISDTKGSATIPVYLNAGAITACTYTLGSTVSSGTASRMAYYSGANAISAASNITVDGTNITLASGNVVATSGQISGRIVTKTSAPSSPVAGEIWITA